MIAILQHHLPGVLHCLLLPAFVADMLPAGNLRQHQQSLAVTFVQKILALGIVGGADRVAAQLLLQDPGVLPLQPFRRSVAHIGIALVPVQPPEEDLLPVEVEAVRPELGSAEAEFHLLHVQCHVVPAQGHPAGVADGMLRVPGLHVWAA